MSTNLQQVSSSILACDFFPSFLPLPPKEGKRERKQEERRETKGEGGGGGGGGGSMKEKKRRKCLSIRFEHVDAHSVNTHVLKFQILTD